MTPQEAVQHIVLIVGAIWIVGMLLVWLFIYGANKMP